MIFACHKLKSGGILRSFLSSSLWQPFSRLCLSVYLVHYLNIEYTQYFGIIPSTPVNMWWEIHIHFGDIVISLILGTIFHLLVEAPAAKLIDIVLKDKPKLITNEKVLLLNVEA
jgi:peptidoglycan/LPS O-acetylase OafA/YrhL